MPEADVTSSARPVAPLAYKPDLEETNRRWEAYWAGEMIDRPIIWATVPRPGFEPLPHSDYRERTVGDLEAILARADHNAAGTLFGGESVPQFMTSFGPGELAAFCGGEMMWSSAGPTTNWARHFVRDWDEALPLRLLHDDPLWQRMLDFYRLGAERLGGKVLLMPLDFHSNMDLLADARGSQQLCLDTIDQPEMIDRAMADARDVFPQVWDAIRTAGRMDELGYAFGAYSMEGVCVLACDFSALISPAMFRRWVRPALEEEAAIVRHAIYHWDGPRALVHFDEVMAIDGIHTISFVPDPGESHLDYLELHQRVQAAGKAVQVWGSVDEMKAMHCELQPDKAIYCPQVEDEASLEAVLDWFVRHT